MKYYLLVGEASGDLHASHLMQALKENDEKADFRFYGGDLMKKVGGTLVKHYKELAYMGFVPVLLHLRTILHNMELCKKDIHAWQPDVVILVDYPGFNLKIAKHLHQHTDIPVFYYISPKIWAWKEWRIKSIKRDVDEMFSILPFEVPFYEKKHQYPIHYVGNPTASEVRLFKSNYQEGLKEFQTKYGLIVDKPIIALLAGSRQQEIKDNLPAMIAAADAFSDRYQLVIAGAPSIDPSYYGKVMKGMSYHPKTPVKVIFNATYPLLSHASAALVTSGTATLETAMFNVPQVVCYKTPLPHLIRLAFKLFLNCKYISLVNLIADQEVVEELFADRFSVDQIRQSLQSILPNGAMREQQLHAYTRVFDQLGNFNAAENAAKLMIEILKQKH